MLMAKYSPSSETRASANAHGQTRRTTLSVARGALGFFETHGAMRQGPFPTSVATCRWPHRVPERHLLAERMARSILLIRHVEKPELLGGCGKNDRSHELRLRAQPGAESCGPF